MILVQTNATKDWENITSSRAHGNRKNIGNNKVNVRDVPKHSLP